MSPPPRSRNLCTLVGHGDQGRFGNSGPESEGKGEYQKPDQAAFAGELLGQAFSQGKEPDIQPENKKGQADNDQNQSDQGGEEFRERLAQDQELKQADDGLWGPGPGRNRAGLVPGPETALRG